jgi:hypothetical protein
MLLFLLAMGSLLWMHLAIRRMERDRTAPAPAEIPAFDCPAQ